MSEIIYFKDVVASKKTNDKKTQKRPKLKPFKVEKIKEVSLVLRKKNDLKNR